MENFERILTSDELKLVTMGMKKEIFKRDVNYSSVPEELKPLIPYVDVWGVVDDVERERVIEATSPDIRENLKWVIRNFDNELDTWLSGPEAVSSTPSDAYVSFSAFRMAVDFI